MPLPDHSLVALGPQHLAARRRWRDAPRCIRARADQLLAAGMSALVGDPGAASPSALRAWRDVGLPGEQDAVGEGGRRAVQLVRRAAQT